MKLLDSINDKSLTQNIFIERGASIEHAAANVAETGAGGAEVSHARVEIIHDAAGPIRRGSHSTRYHRGS